MDNREARQDVFAFVELADAAQVEKPAKANIARDRDTDALLVAHGWLPVRVWEHEEPTAAADRIAHLVLSRR